MKCDKRQGPDLILQFSFHDECGRVMEGKRQDEEVRVIDS